MKPNSITLRKLTQLPLLNNFYLSNNTASELRVLTNLTSLFRMLEYYKTVLGKVRFDETLFRKELRKAFKNLVDDECSELKSWLKDSSYV